MTKRPKNPKYAIGDMYLTNRVILGPRDGKRTSEWDIVRDGHEAGYIRLRGSSGAVVVFGLNGGWSLQQLADLSALMRVVEEGEKR